MTLSRTPPPPQKKKNPVQTIRPNKMSRPEKTRSSISCIEIRTIIPRNLCPRVSLPFNHSLESDDTFYYKKPRRFPFLLRSNTPEKKKMARNALSSPGNVPALRVLTLFLLLLLLPFHSIAARHDYHDALRKSILFFEGQRSGRLPPDQRVRWRKNSALHDGATAGVHY